MITYTTYSEAGGVGKTTTAANLAAAHAERGHRVLVVDLDPQEGSLSYVFDVADDRSDGSADNIVRHLIGRPKGEFTDLIRTDTGEAGVDVLPAHNMLANLTQNMMKAAEIEEDMHQDDDYEWPRNEQLLRLLRENDVPEDYDVVVCDPQATEGDALYNAIYATRSVLLPVELSGKGALSIDGLTDLAEGLEAEVGIDVGVLGIVPVAFKGTNTQQEHLEELEASQFDVPAVFGERSSLMQEMWESQATAFRVVDEAWKEGEKGRRRSVDREESTLDQYRELAAHVEGAFE